MKFYVMSKQYFSSVLPTVAFVPCFQFNSKVKDTGLILSVIAIVQKLQKIIN